MAKEIKINYCAVPECNGPAYWGFHDRWFCTPHRGEGEKLFAATNDGHSAGSVLRDQERPVVVQVRVGQQGKLI